MTSANSRDYDPSIMRYDGLAASIASNPETYETFLGRDFGNTADYLFPEMPVLQALHESTIQTPVDEKHLSDPNFLQGALEGLIDARKQKGARL